MVKPYVPLSAPPTRRAGVFHDRPYGVAPYEGKVLHALEGSCLQLRSLLPSFHPSILPSLYARAGPKLTHASRIASSMSAERFLCSVKISAATSAPSHPLARAAAKTTTRRVDVAIEIP